jgi:hypothetical protein
MTDERYYASFQATSADGVRFLRELLEKEGIEYSAQPGSWGWERGTFSLSPFRFMELYTRSQSIHDSLVTYLTLRGDNGIAFSLPLRDNLEEQDWYLFDTGYRIGGRLNFMFDGNLQKRGESTMTALYFSGTVDGKQTRKLDYWTSDIIVESVDIFRSSLGEFIEETEKALEILAGKLVEDKKLRYKAKLLLVYFRLGLLDQAVPEINKDIHWFDRFQALDLDALLGDDKYFEPDRKWNIPIY